MKRAFLALLLLPLVVGCQPSPTAVPLSPAQYQIGKAILQDEFRHQEITRDKAELFLANLQDGASEWQCRYGK
jgi:hypothetical protein